MYWYQTEDRSKMPVDWSMLPNDIVRMVMQYDRSDRMRMRRLKDECVHELETLFEDVRQEYYHTELMDVEGGGYGYMLDADGIEEELDDYIAWWARC